MKRGRRIISDVASMPAAAIERELSQVQEERRSLRSKLESLRADETRLEMEEQVLAQMLRLRQWEADGVPGAANTVNALTKAAPQARRANLSANVLSTVQQAGVPLTPSDVQRRLDDNGIHADLNAVRVALRRWVERERLVKHDRHYVSRDLSPSFFGGEA